MTGGAFRFGVLLVGTGRIARSHYDALSRLEGGELVGVVDKNVETARLFLNEIDDNSAQLYTSLEQALSETSADVAIICSPTSSHESVASQIMRSGLHVLVEKPFTTDVASAMRMSKVSHESGVHLMAAQIVRFLPMFEWAESFIRDGGLGRPIHFVERRMVYRRENYPWWSDLPYFLVSHWGSHSVDIVCHLLAQYPTRAFCDGSSESGDYEVVDDFDLFMRLNGTTRASFHMSFSSRTPVHDMILNGESHSLSFRCYESVAVDGDVVLQLPEDEMLRRGFDRQLEHFRDVVAGVATPMADAASVMPSLKGIAAAEQSIRTTRLVNIT